jgi:sporulation protein YlmC with PRC-barrel domain
MNNQPAPTVINRTAPIRLIEGMTVEAADGVFGELADLIIDPIHRHVIHLVVQPLHRHDQARLVPVDAVATSDGHLMLSWSADRIRHMKPIEETEFIRLGHWAHPEPGWDVGNTRVLAWPYYGAGSIGLTLTYDQRFGGRSALATNTYDRIPAGTAEIRRSSDVVSSDDHVVGHVDGFVVDPDDAISHLILERGHLWGHREVTIPMRDVESVISDQIRLRTARDQIAEFPAAAFHHHDTVSPEPRAQ